MKRLKFDTDDLDLTNLSQTQADKILMEAGWTPILSAKFLVELERITEEEGCLEEDAFNDTCRKFSKKNNLVYYEDTLNCAIGVISDVFFL